MRAAFRKAALKIPGRNISTLTLAFSTLFPNPLSVHKKDQDVLTLPCFQLQSILPYFGMDHFYIA